MGERDDRKFELDLEKGYCRVPNLFLDALPLTRLNGTQRSILIYILRRTLGWNREYDAIPMSDIAAACRISRKNASRQISDLVNKNMIHRIECRNQVTNLYGLVIDPAEWSPDCFKLKVLLDNRRMAVYKGNLLERLNLLPKKEVELIDADIEPARESGGDLSGVEVGPWEGDAYTQQTQAQTEFEQCLNTDKDSKNRKNNKDNKNRKNSKVFSPESIPFQLSELLLVKIKEHLPSFKTPDLQKWSISMDRLIRLDKRDPEEVREIILFAQSDPFWCANILSVDSLRSKYDTLNLRRIKLRDSQAKSDNRRGKDDWRIESDEYEQFFK